MTYRNKHNNCEKTKGDHISSLLQALKFKTYRPELIWWGMLSLDAINNTEKYLATLLFPKGKSPEYKDLYDS